MKSKKNLATIVLSAYLGLVGCASTNSKVQYENVCKQNTVGQIIKEKHSNYHRIPQEFLKETLQRGALGYKKALYFLSETLILQEANLKKFIDTGELDEFYTYYDSIKPNFSKEDTLNFRKAIINKYLNRLNDLVENEKVIAYFTGEAPETVKDDYTSYNDDKLTEGFILLLRKLGKDPSYQNFWGGSPSAMYIEGNQKHLVKEHSKDSEAIASRNRYYKNHTSRYINFNDLKTKDYIQPTISRPDTIFIYPNTDAKTRHQSLTHELLHSILTHDFYDQQTFYWFEQIIDDAILNSYMPEDKKEKWDVENYSAFKLLKSVDIHPIVTKEEFKENIKNKFKKKLKYLKKAKEQYNTFIKEFKAEYDLPLLFEK